MASVSHYPSTTGKNGFREGPTDRISYNIHTLTEGAVRCMSCVVRPQLLRVVGGEVVEIRVRERWYRISGPGLVEARCPVCGVWTCVEVEKWP